MFQLVRNKKNALPEVFIEKNNLGKPVDGIEVDQYYSQDFTLGENGFPRSDVSMLLSAQSEEIKMQVAMRMKEVQAKYPDQDLSDEQLAAMSIPRNVQSAADFKSWFSQLKDEGFEKTVKAYYEAHKPKSDPSPDVIKFDENEPKND